MLSEYLPEEIEREIYSTYRPCELIEYLRKNPQNVSLFRGPYFIKKLAFDHDLPYFAGITLGDLCYYDSLSKRDLLKLSAKIGDERLVVMLINNPDVIEDRQFGGTEVQRKKKILNMVINEAAGGGHEKIVQMMIDEGADDFNSTMSEATGRGHEKIVQMMIDEGADDFYWMMSYAAGGGHEKIVQMMIDEGADDFNRAMTAAARGGHEKIVQMMIDEGADNFDEVMEEATKGGHEKIINLLKFYM